MAISDRGPRKSAEKLAEQLPTAGAKSFGNVSIANTLSSSGALKRRSAHRTHQFDAIHAGRVVINQFVATSWRFVGLARILR